MKRLCNILVGRFFTRSCPPAFRPRISPSHDQICFLATIRQGAPQDNTAAIEQKHETFREWRLCKRLPSLLGINFEKRQNWNIRCNSL